MSEAVSLRPATIEDRDAVFAWANDEVTRANSFRADPIPYADHVRWFDRVLASETQRLFIARGARDEDLGILRLDDEGEGKAVVSINVAPSARGRGVGLLILRAASDQARGDGYTLLEAFIRPANGASHAVFQRAGYRRVERTLIADEDADRYELELGARGEDMKFIPYGRQTIEDDDVAAVVETLRSDYLTTGPRVPEFEARLCEITGAKHAVAVSNGTAALHAAVFAAGVGPGDEVLVPAITFVASANCARYQGADVQFVDVDPDTALIDVADLERRMSDRTKAVVAVDMAGAPVDLDAIRALCDQRGVALIEDAAHSLGTTYKGKTVGGRPADLATFSFHPVKHITTGEGGAITTDDDALAQKLRLFRDHGLRRTEDQFEHPSPGPWYYEQDELGHNLRLSAIQCALGLSQLAKLDRFLERRRALVDEYATALGALDGVELLARPAYACEPAYHLAVALIDFERAGRGRAEVMDALRAAGIGTQVHYIPVCSQPYYRRLGADPAAYPGAQRYYERCLSLPLFPGMGDGDVERVVGALRGAIS